MSPHIKSIYNFTNMLSQDSFLSHRLISFDVESHFTRVPRSLSRMFSTHFTEEIFQLPIGTFINLMKVCMTNIFCFAFGDRYFK